MKDTEIAKVVKTNERSSEPMPIDIDDVIERAFEHAFMKALDQTLQKKAEDIFTKLLGNGSPLAKRLEEKIEQGVEKFLQEGIRWEKKKAGFKK